MLDIGTDWCIMASVMDEKDLVRIHVDRPDRKRLKEIGAKNDCTIYDALTIVLDEHDAWAKTFAAATADDVKVECV